MNNASSEPYHGLGKQHTQAMAQNPRCLSTDYLQLIIGSTTVSFACNPLILRNVTAVSRN